MAEAVASALDGNRHLLVQAGTGTGKSLAYLVPALLHARSGSGRVVVATATLALQHQLVERDLPRLVDAIEPVIGRRPVYAVLKGRQNYVCLDRLHRAGPDDDTAALFDAPQTALGKQSVALREWAEQTDTGDRDDYPDPVDPRVWRGLSVSSRECVGKARCGFGEECFAERARDRAREADVVVTNHALLAIGALEGIPVLPEHDAVVIDEGHELVDRATAAVTMELSSRTVERAAGRARRSAEDEVVDRLADAGDDLAEALQSLAGQSVRRIQGADGPLAAALVEVRDAAHAVITAINRTKLDASDAEGIARRQLVRAALDEVHDAAVRLSDLTEHDVAWLDAGEQRTPALKLAPLSVSGLLRLALFEQSTVIVTSATLTLGGSFDPLAASFGLAGPAAPRWDSLDVGSPFDFARQGILYVAAHLPSPGRDGLPEEALDELGDLVAAAGGRTLALFSSWRAVDRAADYLRVRLGEKAPGPLHVQRRGDSVGDLVKRFAADERSTLLGTLSLWQGVDVPGPACTCVVIDRIPFPRPDDPLVAARQQAVDDKGGSGFRAVSVPRAALLLAQGVGRLIRGGDDRGVVAVLDPRLATAGYGGFLRASLPPFWYTVDGSLVRAALTRLDAGFTESDRPGAVLSGAGRAGSGANEDSTG
ncbi:MAG: ATP-dependent DNA helicase [Actinomycetota bacterium]|nr:MAG: ATP-dependent DNA helicase [Actinomycetota bacterium]